MKRNDMRHPYPAHSGVWRASASPRIRPNTQPMNFWHVMGGIILAGGIIGAAVGFALAALRGTGAFHG